MRCQIDAERSFRAEVAKQLDRARHRMGLSMRELSRRSGVGRVEAGKYLGGKRRITVRALFSLAEALGLEVEIDLIAK